VEITEFGLFIPMQWMPDQMVFMSGIFSDVRLDFMD